MKKIYVLFALFLCAFSVSAQIESGSVYRIINDAYSRAVAEDYTQNNIITTTPGTSNTDWEQLWIVTNTSGNSYSFQNVFTHRFMSNKVYRSQWMTTSTADADKNFTLAASAFNSAEYTFLGSTEQFVHCASSQGYHLVGWNDTSADAVNAFALNKVEGVDLAAAYTAYQTMNDPAQNVSTYDTALRNVFSDRAYTTLNSRYMAMSDNEFNLAVNSLNLPDELKAMIRKIKNNTWAEHEQRYRVRNYKAYSDCNRWAGVNNTYAQTNMNNPTGIVSNGRSVVYVMVDSVIPADATLSIAGVYDENLQNSANPGTALHQGLNVIVTPNDGTAMYIFYTANTHDGTTTTHELSEFPDIKIHIEGGDVYGYYDTAVDQPSDFTWWSSNIQDSRFTAVKMAHVLGSFASWYVHKEDLCAVIDSSNIEKSMMRWDQLVYWEHSLCGIIYDNADSYADNVYNGTLMKTVTHEWIDGSESSNVYGRYYNNHAMAYSTDGYFMYASGNFTHYQKGNTVRTVLLYANMLNTGNDWGPSHEIGHQHQNAICLPNTSESSNNLFSNVNRWMHGVVQTNGTYMSEGKLPDYLARTPFISQDISSQMRMFYQLFLYYHAAGHNKKFYPNLFQALREDPMISHKGGSQLTTGTGTFFHFVEKCCDIAGEDLTDFFRSWGFFVPYTGDKDDYGVYHMSITQEQIDQCLATIAAKNYPKNTSIIFIEDRVDLNAPVTGMAAAGAYTEDGVAANSVKVKIKNESAGVVGQYTDFVDNGTTPSGYTITQDGMTITPTGGTGAVGYLIYDENDSLVAFFNTASFTFPESYNGGAVTIKAIGSSETTQDVPGFNPQAALSVSFQEALESANGYIEHEDLDGKHPGMYRSQVLFVLKNLAAQATQVLVAQDYSQYGTLHEALLAEMASIDANPDAHTPISYGAYYRLQNVAYTNRHMSYQSNNDDGKVSTTTSNVATYTDQWWQFTPGSADNTYHISAYNGNYITAVPGSTWASANSANEADAKNFTAQFRSDGAVYLEIPGANNGGIHCASNNNYRVVGWNSGASASWWLLEEVQSASESSAKYGLMNLLSEAEVLVEQVSDKSLTASTAMPLQATDANGAYYISSNADYNTLNNAHDGAGIPGLLDGNINTFFHSDYGGKVSEDHYLQVDLGSENKLNKFILSYTTRPNAGGYYLNKPTNIIVSGSNDGTIFTPVCTLSKNDANPLPFNQSSQQSYTSDPIESQTPYRYWRFTVTATNSNQKSNEHVFFTMAEFSMLNVETSYEPKSGYEGLDMSLVSALGEDIDNAAILLNDGSTTDSQFETAITGMQTDYDALNDALTQHFNPSKQAIEELLPEAEALFAEVATKTTETVTLPLQSTDAGSAYYISSNADYNTLNNAHDGAGIPGLIDGNINTFFHSDYGGKVNEDHYLQVDLGSGNELNQFVLNYTTRPNNNGNYLNKPTNIVISGSNDGTNFVTVKTLTKNDANPLPFNQSSQESYTSDPVESGTAYRYWRFTVTATNSDQKSNNHVFFTMAEFALRHTNITYTKNADYEWMDMELISALDGAITVASELLDDRDATEVQFAPAFTNLQNSCDAVTDAIDKHNYVPEPLSATLLTAQQILDMQNGESKTVVIGNPQKNNGYFFGYDGTNKVSTLFGATMQAGSEKALAIAGDSYYRLTLRKDNNGKYVIESANTAGKYIVNPPAWGDTEFGWTALSVASLGSTSDMSAGYQLTDLVRFSTDGGANYFNSQGNINSWGIRGGTGEWSVWCVYEVTGEPLPRYDVTYEYRYNGETIDTEVHSVLQGNTYPAPKAFDFSTALATPEGTVSAAKTQTFDVDFVNFPFELSADYAHAKWHIIKMRYNRYVYYAPGNTTTETQTSTTLSYDDEYQWAFVGTPLSFRIINRAAGSGKYLKYKEELKNELSSTQYTDYVAVEDATVHDNDRNVYIKVKDASMQNCFINLRNNTMAYWDNAGAKGEVGSALGLKRLVDITIGAAKQGTYASEYNLDFTGREDIHAYWCDGVTGSYLNMIPFTTTIPAGAGFYIAGESGTYSIPVSDSAEEIDGENCFVGNTTGANLKIQQTEEREGTTYTNYILQNHDGKIRFYIVNHTTGNSVGNNRAYLSIPQHGDAAKEWYEIDGDATAVADIAKSQELRAESYNLGGVRVGADYKGIVIINGKKILKK